MLMLKKNYEFQTVLKKGKWYGGNLLNVYIMKNNKDFNLLGVAVGKKVSKSSVIGNRIRRLIKECYRLDEINLKTGINIVIVWKTSCSFELADFHEIKNDLKKCFEKAGVYIKEDKNV